MKYKYTGTEAQLTEHGFEVESYLRLVHATKEVSDDDIYIVLTWGSAKEDSFDDTVRTLVWNSQTKEDDIQPYIQDLIDAGLVEVEE